jgi:hypothetical protein
MSDCYRDLEKRDRLGDPSPPLSRCTACRGYRLVRGKRCPECDGAGTAEAQTSHLAMLVECAAAERVPRQERAVVTAEGLAKEMGGPILDLFRMTMGPGDVLVWRTKTPPRHAARFCRRMLLRFPPEHRPSAFIMLRPGESFDVFNVPGLSDDAIATGLRGVGDRLAEVRPDGGLVIPATESACLEASPAGKAST